MKKGECFYENGLDFKCKQGCIDCCANESGFVFLCKKDIDNIAKATGLSREQAVEVYTRIFTSDSGEKRLVLKEYSNKRCIFLSDNGCKIYSNRPIQCSIYPFWPRVIASREAWDSESKMCPGINDESACVSKGDIDEQLALFKAHYETL